MFDYQKFLLYKPIPAKDGRSLCPCVANSIALILSFRPPFLSCSFSIPVNIQDVLKIRVIKYNLQYM